jgi:hypothetical protein
MSTKLKSYFKGEHVSVLIKSMRATQEVEGSLYTGPVVIDGIYIDEDSTFLFLADSNNDITEAIAKKDITRIFINNPLNDGSLPPDNIN